MKIKQKVDCIFTLLSGCILDTKCTFCDELAVHQRTGAAEAEHIVVFIYSVAVYLCTVWPFTHTKKNTRGPVTAVIRENRNNLSSALSDISV